MTRVTQHAFHSIVNQCVHTNIDSNLHKIRSKFTATANYVPHFRSGMLTGAFCRGGSTDGDAAATSLVVVPEEVALDLPLLLRHQVLLTPRPSPLRGGSSPTRARDGGEVILVEEVTGDGAFCRGGC
jgi:hypothetical protein